MDTLELGLKGKVAIITGASEGLGRATAQKFAECGARVAMCARRPDVLDEAAKTIQKATGAEIVALAKSLPTSMSRAAGINLTKSLSKEYAADQIRVNTICLGVVKSAQWTRRFKGGDLNAFYTDMAKQRGVPLGRLGEAEEFADLVAFLASERAK